MSPPEWLVALLHLTYTPQDGAKGRKLAAVADRMDRRSETLASAVAHISESFDG